MLGTAYGTKNLDEFVAEAMSNPQFQADLAGLNPNGSDVNALQRFFNSVGNFIRRLIGRDAKDIDSALTRADMLINEILAPAPEYRDANSLAMMSDAQGVKQIMNAVGKVQKVVSSPFSKRQRGAFGRGWANLLDSSKAKGRRGLLSLVDLQGLADVAGHYNEKVGLIAVELNTTIKEMRGMMDNRANVVSKEIAKVDKWLKKAGVEGKKHLDDLIYSSEYGATIYQVDPTKKRSEYEGKTDENGNDLAQVWDAQRSDWNALGAEGQTAYRTMRDMYKNLYNDLKKVINERIDATAEDKAQADRQKKELFAKLFDSKALDVYFPLIREGKYKLDYTYEAGKAPKGEDLHGFLMFKDKAERDRLAKEFRKNPDIKEVKVYDGDFTVDKMGSGAPSSAFMNDVLKVVGASGVDPVVQDQLLRMFIATLPESSFAKSFQKRQGIAGYDTDSVYAMKTKGFDLARQIERMRYTGKIKDLENQLADKDIAPREGQESQLNEVRRELVMRTEFARLGSNNPLEFLARNANQLAFVYTIGFNAASAMVQLAQVPMFVYPMLGAKYGYDNTQAEIMRASNIVMGAGMRGGEGFGDRVAVASGIDQYYEINNDATEIELKKDLNVPDKIRKDLELLKPLVLKAYRQGDLSRSFLLDTLGTREGGRAYKIDGIGSAVKAGSDFTVSASAYMFNQAERLNRQTTLVAAYQLELNRLNKEQPNLPKDVRENMAADTAIYNTQELNTGATLETAPRISQKGLGRVAMMYKTYGLRMYYTMLKTARELLKDYRKARIDSGVLKSLADASTGVAAKQLIGIHGSAIFFSGIHGIPLYGAVQFMFDNNIFGFRNLIRELVDLFEEEETVYPEQGDDFNTIVRDYLGEGWYKGAVNAALAEAGLGADISSRIRLTGLLIQQNRFNPEPSIEEVFGFYLGGPSLSVIKRGQRGVNDLFEGNIERGIESLLPAGVSNMLKAAGRYNREGILNRKGNPIYEDITNGELFTQFFGFAPSEYIRIQEQSQNLKNIDKKTNKKRSKLMENYYLAVSNYDFDEQNKLLKEILGFNRANPSFAIDKDTLFRSVKQRYKSAGKMYNGVALSPNMLNAIAANRVGLEETFIAPE
jgi:F0F1-type ATP synthase membrane subunit b/b'